MEIQVVSHLINTWIRVAFPRDIERLIIVLYSTCSREYLENQAF